jgi:hypothetical protein
MIYWKLGPLDCRFDETTYNYDGTINRGHPSLYMFLDSASPFRTIAMQPGETLRDAQVMSADIAAGIFSGWLKEVGQFRTENKL